MRRDKESRSQESHVFTRTARSGSGSQAEIQIAVQHKLIIRRQVDTNNSTLLCSGVFRGGGIGPCPPLAGP